MARRCPVCEVEGPGVSPYRATGGEQKREHPELKEERLSFGLTIDRCPNCQGVYLDHRELERVEDAGRGKGPSGSQARYLVRVLSQGRRPEDARAEEERALRDCPACGDSMMQREWRSTLVYIDVCLGCRGIWLDEGEFETLAAHYGSPRQ